jgi:hypothetical protein
MARKFLQFVGLGSSFLVAAILVATSSANAATLNVVGGQLLGASGVNVGGSFYDVAFVAGTCTGLFSGCDSAADFTFVDPVSATGASQALLDQVFQNGVLGNFDTVPSLTNGCTSPTLCKVATPFALSGSFAVVIWADNYANELGDGTTSGAFSKDGNLAGVSTQTFAVWTPVPEPGTALLMGLGLVMMGVQSRRREA